MSRSALVNVAWADGDYDFRLRVKELEELQEITNCGPHFLFRRVSSGDWWVRDLRETIRLGLIGGGMEAVKAKTLVERYFDPGPYLQHVATVQAILGACIAGAPDGEKPGKRGAAKARTKSSQTGDSPLPPSTAPVPQ